MLSVDRISKTTACELFRQYDEIKDAVRDRLEMSDQEFAGEQMDALRGVMRFEVDSWDNVFARPAVDVLECGELARAVKNNPFSYPVELEPVLSELEIHAAYAEYVDPYNVPGVLYASIEDTMQKVCDVMARDIHLILTARFDYDDDDLIEYFFYDFKEYLSLFPSLIESEFTRALVAEEEGFLSLDTLSDDQLQEVTEDVLCRIFDGCFGESPSYGELASARELVPFEMIRVFHDGTTFTNDDYFCTAGR